MANRNNKDQNVNQKKMKHEETTGEKLGSKGGQAQHECRGFECPTGAGPNEADRKGAKASPEYKK